MNGVTFSTVADLLAGQYDKQSPRRFTGELQTGLGGLDECEPDRAVRLIEEAGLAVYSAAVHVDMLPSTDRIAEASRLLADAYRLIEDAEALTRQDRNGVPE